MKKRLLKTFVVILLISSVLIASVFLLENFDTVSVVKYVKNENLPTVKAGWQGTPVDEKGRFVNAEFPFLQKTSDLLKWQLGARPFAEEKKADAERLQVLDAGEFLSGEKDGILWLGHASVYVRLGGKAILIDPVFGNPPFVKRFVEVPNPLEKIAKVDFVLITHDHRDHCDEATLKAVFQKFPNAKIFTGLGMEDLLNDWKQPSNELINTGWYQQSNLADDLKITFAPTRHWSRRGLFDTNKRLWGAFLIEGAGRKIYHGGDSGYGSHYKELFETFGAVDFFIVGIGAYEPRWFMNSNHQSPEDALRAFVDAQAGTLIPMHYGTFDLSDEPPSQPLKILREEAEKRGLSNKLKPLQINESFEF